MRTRMRSYTVAKKHGEMQFPIYFPSCGICDYHEGMSIIERVRLIFRHLYEWMSSVFFIWICLCAYADATSVELLFLTYQCTIYIYVYYSM